MVDVSYLIGLAMITVSCAACDLFCPDHAEPYARILDRFYTKYLRHGLPERARYFMPTELAGGRSDLASRAAVAGQRTLHGRVLAIAPPL